MRRFFLEDIVDGQKTVRIDGEEFVHLKKVLRLKVGDEVSVFNGSGVELAGVIDSVENGSAIVLVTGRVMVRKDSPVPVILLQGLVKKDKPEIIVEKATELGASAIVFYQAARTVSTISPEKAVPRLARWRRVAIGASKQCGRSTVPRLHFSAGLEAAIKEADSPLRLMALENAHTGCEGGRDVRGLREVLGSFAGGVNPSGVSILIGPEGGFTEGEADIAGRAGFQPVSLGPRTLRAETAAVAILSIIGFELGDIGRR